jgi:hypothetical protein
MSRHSEPTFSNAGLIIRLCATPGFQLAISMRASSNIPIYILEVLAACAPLTERSLLRANVESNVPINAENIMKPLHFFRSGVRCGFDETLRVTRTLSSKHFLLARIKKGHQHEAVAGFASVSPIRVCTGAAHVVVFAMCAGTLTPPSMSCPHPQECCC